MSTAVAHNPPHPDYGIDAPVVVKRMFSRAAWCIGVALVAFIVNRSEYPGPADHLLAALGGLGAIFLAIGGFMIWSSRVAKLGLRDRLLDSLELSGSEKLLDAGCGRGLMLIGAAKRLKTGRATGIDIWSAEDLSGNSADAARQNAKIEGVSDKVRIENGDVRKLVYPEANFDVVISSLAIHNIEDREERAQAVGELWRVLKPGGKLLIFDIFHTAQYAKILRARGAREVTLSGLGFLWCVPSRSLIARK